MFIVFYTVAFVVCFYAYREFKGMLFEQMGSATMMGMGSMGGMGGAGAAPAPNVGY